MRHFEVRELDPVRDLSNLALKKAGRRHHSSVFQEEKRDAVNNEDILTFVPEGGTMPITVVFGRNRKAEDNRPTVRESEIFVRSSGRICHCLQRAIHSLSRPERNAVSFVYLRGISHSDAAAKMRMSRKKFDEVLASALGKLASKVEQFRQLVIN